MEHIKINHHELWLKSRRLRRLATSSLIVSLILTILLSTVFYYPDAVGYSVMGLATLFLAFSAAFSLRDRSLPKRFRTEIKRKTKDTRKTQPKK